MKIEVDKEFLEKIAQQATDALAMAKKALENNTKATNNATKVFNFPLDEINAAKIQMEVLFSESVLLNVVDMQEKSHNFRNELIDLFKKYRVVKMEGIYKNESF